MGYRSDIVIVTKIENKELVKLLQEDEENTDEQYFFSMEDYNGKKMECFFTRYEYVKWYDSFPSVNKIRSAMDNIEDGDSFGFIRVGEDYDDVESLGMPYDFNIQLSRTIDVNFSYNNNYHIKRKSEV